MPLLTLSASNRSHASNHGSPHSAPHHETIPAISRMSNSFLFLANIRLLDLHLLPDCPDLLKTQDAPIFEFKPASSQKARINALEWILYHLFRIHAPSVAKDKLAPFFPPLEPLQSINLRAAIFRCLTEMKKSGELGKEVVLRKTMMDECKGDKFEELVICFSGTVVRKVLKEKSGKSTLLRMSAGLKASRGMSLAMADSVNVAKDGRDMEILSLAQRADLDRVLRRREELGRKLDDMSRCLDRREWESEQRRNTIDQVRAGAGHVPRAQIDATSTLVQHAWTGHIEEGQRLVHGLRKHCLTDATSFNGLWKASIEGKVGHAGTSLHTMPPLLQEALIQQKGRLQRWNQIRSESRASLEARGVGPVNDNLEQGLALHDHYDIRPAPTSKALPDNPIVQPNAAYNKILSTLESALKEVGKVSQAELQYPRSVERRHMPAASDFRPVEAEPQTPILQNSQIQAFLHESEIHDAREEDSISAKVRSDSTDRGSMAPPALNHSNVTPTRHQQINQTLADHMQTSRNASSGASSLLDMSSPLAKQPFACSHAPFLPDLGQPNGTDDPSSSHTSLADATRQSVAASLARTASNAKQKPRNTQHDTRPAHPDRSRSSVQTHGAAPFETPKTLRRANTEVIVSASEQADLVESSPFALESRSVEDYADMASVFKSRPKIAPSPLQQSSFWGDDAI